MNTKLVTLIGDPIENLYQLGLKEKDAFLKIEKRVTNLISINPLLRLGQDLYSRAKFILKKKKTPSYFDQCITAYSEGLGIDSSRYMSFLSLLEVAAHYGQVYPELLSLLPGCSSVFMKSGEEYTHTRLLDFPLVGIFEDQACIYYWQKPGAQPLMTFSCEGLAPLFLQGIHGSGMSFALHHKPGKNYHEEGQSIFEIALESMFEATDFSDLKKNFKKKVSITKWCLLLMDKSGHVLITDIDGPSQKNESYHLNDNSPLIFTNIPLQHDAEGFEDYLSFSHDRQKWIKDKLKNLKSGHILDTLTDVEDQKVKKWTHSGATLSTVAAYHINLTKGVVDLKEGQKALVQSDSILRLNLDGKKDLEVIKPQGKEKNFEKAWKRASLAQSAFDQGDYDLASHELQMAIATMPHPIWKEIMSFYLYLWDFKFISSTKELSLVYKKVRALDLPVTLQGQWLLFIMRLEKKLELSQTVNINDIPLHLKDLFQQEQQAPKALFATWMKLLYPRLEILSVFSPHHK
jgi:hypothetical protein